MPALLRQIEATIIDNHTSDIEIIEISGVANIGTYIKLNKFEGFLQNFSNVSKYEEYETPINFGLVRNKKEEFIKLEITY